LKEAAEELFLKKRWEEVKREHLEQKVLYWKKNFQEKIGLFSKRK